MKKICFVSSSGGHWEELMCLKEIADENDSFFITEKGGQIDDFGLSEKYYAFDQINRKEKGFFIKFIRLFKKAKNILDNENPDVIISTGALVSYPFCLIGKLKKKKIIYIESFARVTGKSLTGSLVYPFADLFLVQWEQMLEFYPKAKYVGSIF